MTEAPRAGTVTLTGLVKRYGTTLSLDGVSLAIVPGEFFTLLGPSGCGKTTTLRSVAGFVTPDAGAVAINGADVTGVGPPQPSGGKRVQTKTHITHPTRHPNTARAIRASSRAASSSGWRWRARWSHDRRCSCWTSRWARSTRSSATT